MMPPSSGKRIFRSPSTTFAAELKSVTYQEQLGSVCDKVQRTKTALWLTEELFFRESIPVVERAAEM